MISNGLAHIGCSVTDMDKMLAFLKETAGTNSVRTQYIEYPYLSGVVGIPGCAIHIGFASRDGGAATEVLDYRSKNPRVFENGFCTVGSGSICYSVENSEEVIEECRANGADILIDVCKIDGGPLDGRKHFFAGKCGVWTEFVENDPLGLLKATFVVSDIMRGIRFFERLGMKIDETFHKKLNGEEYTAALLYGTPVGPAIELIEPQKKIFFDGEICSDMTGNVHCCFFTEGIGDLFEELCRNGAAPQGRVTHITHGVNAGATAVYMTAPDGIKIELFEGKPTKI